MLLRLSINALKVWSFLEIDEQSLMNPEQSHPLYAVDRELVNRLLAKTIPNEEDLVDLARLLIRYEGFSGAVDLKRDIIKSMEKWGFTREELNVKTRKIWQKGFKPGMSSNDVVGSGFDTADKDEK